MRRRTQASVAVALGVVVVVVAGMLLGPALRPDPSQPRSGPGDASGDWRRVGHDAREGWRPKAADLPRFKGSPGPVRVRDDLPLPTNRWYSGMVFGETAQPVFAVPLAVQATPGGVTVGLPRVTASTTTIAGPFVPELELGLRTDGFTAERGDPVSVVSTYRSAGRAVGRLLLAEGWPYGGYTALRDQVVDVPAGLTRREGGRWWSVDVGGTTYGLAVAAEDGSRQSVRPSGGTVRLAAGQSLLVFAGPDSQTAAALAEGAVPVRGTSVSYDQGGARTRTRIVYRTAGGRPTVVAAMPHHRLTAGVDGVGTVESIYGPLRLFRGRALTTAVRTVHPKGTLDLRSLTDADRTQLRSQVEQDATEVLEGPAPPTDTYFGGKALHRLAQLSSVARAVGAERTADQLRARVVDELDAWLDRTGGCPADATRCFGYDTAFGGVVGRAPSFGSEEFNDHHFHYGYFLAAAGIVGRQEPDLLERWRPTLTALAEDIASPVTDRLIPALRNFDPYTGHSWASGTSPFADGNNQESSSEAITAWNGLALWAGADGNDRLAEQATWQLSLEAASAKSYWLEPENLPEEYQHGFASLNWGGKRDWATWFSPEPSAILGIQLIPMPPVFEEVGATPERVRANVEEATADGFDVEFGDYLTMYLAMADPERALAAGRELPDSAIDDGNTRSYLLAWLLRQARSG
ncbi:MAG TPA: glycosyl hydrolase [Nocardioidaceae bacterium]|nr:glycosyl hydrolase [Nocardioidaceae bacterium]